MTNDQIIDILHDNIILPMPEYAFPQLDSLLFHAFHTLHVMETLADHAVVEINHHDQFLLSHMANLAVYMVAYH